MRRGKCVMRQGLRLAVAIWMVMPVAARAATSETPMRVPLIRILATPASFDGRPISVEGYLHIKFEEDALYLDEDAFKSGLTSNAVWIDTRGRGAPDLRRSNGKHVRLTGVFRSSETGHMGAYSGALTNVSAVSVITSRKDYERGLSRMRLLGLWTDWWPKLMLAGIVILVLGGIALIRRGRRR